MAQMQTLKSANGVRVDTARGTQLYSTARTLGESLMCPASAQRIQNDVYGRPATQNTLPMKLDASCASGSLYPAPRIIAVENAARPYIPICASGLRGSSDFMGVGRDLNPKGLFADDESGNFVRQYNTMNDAPWDNPDRRPGNYHRTFQPFSFTHDASRAAYYQG